jgi:hypothetical protein
MEKTRFNAEFEDFYNTCLADLKSRANYTEGFIPMLERYVTITAKLSALNSQIMDEEVVVDHTNKANHTNQATSPKWRMFLALNKEANQLAKDLELTPSTAPVSSKGKEKKGFDLSSKMKIA